MNLFLYAITVLIWGTTWLAISFQLGDIPVLLSIFYRFALASVLFLPGMLLLGKLQPTGRRDHPYLFLLGLCLFSCNFIFFYVATQYVVSGLISVVFSLATLYNAVNNRLFYKEAITVRTIVAALIGVCGLILLFWHELFVVQEAVQEVVQETAQEAAQGIWSGDTLKGLGLAALGTYLFSLGNMLSKRHSQNGIQPLSSNAWGMFYGSLILAVLLLATQTPIILPSEPRYIGALFYLAIIGSIVGFTTYLMLVARIGASQAAYATVLFPIVALSLSSVYEGYVWHLQSYIGLALAIGGNLLMAGKIGPGRLGRKIRPERLGQKD